MFKVEITEEYTKIQGTVCEKLTGLACYIQALRKSGMPDIFIKSTIEIGFEDIVKEKKAETILDSDNMKIKKFDLNNMSKEEVKELLEKEIFSMLEED